MLATITIDGTLLMFHLSYYSIAQYIRLLQGQLTDYHNDKTLFSSWKGKKRVLRKLHKASVALSAVFSVPVLLTIDIKLFTLSLVLFSIIYCLIRPNAMFASSAIITMSLHFIFYLTHLVAILHAADMPVRQVCLSSNYKKLLYLIAY